MKSINQIFMEKIKIGDFMKYFRISFRSIFFYIFITIVYKVMGKREIGELSIIDLIVSLFIAELVAISIENYKDSILVSVVPIMILVLLQIITSHLSLNHKKIRDILDGKPSVMIKNGVINFQEMKKQRYNIDDLLSQLREAGVKSIEEVDYAILETNGKLSVFEKTKKNKDYPLAIILDGKIEEEVLKEIEKDKEWLNLKLKEKNILLENIVYAFYQKKQLYIIEKEQ